MQPRSFYRTVLAALSTFALIFGWSQIMQAQTENVLFSFPNGAGGADPRGGVVFDSAGNLYGTTPFGGQGCNGSGCGVVFELSPSSSGWTEKILYTFSGGWDGGNPWRTLVFDAAGNLYGTGTVGGNLSACTGHSCGVVFKLSPQSNGAWKETVLHAFQGGTDGSSPIGTLILDSAGNLYGTTRWGGSSTSNCFPAVGCGIVFELSPTASGPWKEKILRTFLSDANGGEPYEGLTLDASGNLYGTTAVGGYQGNGVAYRLSRNSSGQWQETVLYEFARLSSTDGIFPTSHLTFDAAGNLYGTTPEGGSTGHGTVFELSPSSTGHWKEKLLHQFGDLEAAIPEGGVIFDSAGNLWGTTSNDGQHYFGTIFELSPGSAGIWNESVFYLNGLDGADPFAGLTLGADGNLYGATTTGGNVSAGYGVVFEFVP
jgi:uncharacterized repeat protein (TIGR03803 family)